MRAGEAIHWTKKHYDAIKTPSCDEGEKGMGESEIADTASGRGY